MVLSQKPDVFRKCADFRIANLAREGGFYPYYRMLSSAQDPEVVIAGRTVVMLGSNNYLGLANHPEVKAASAAALERFGTGCAGSRLLNGTLEVHVELEERLAAFTRREAALTFATGFQVNLGVLSCLLGHTIRCSWTGSTTPASSTGRGSDSARSSSTDTTT